METRIGTNPEIEIEFFFTRLTLWSHQLDQNKNASPRIAIDNSLLPAYARKRTIWAQSIMLSEHVCPGLWALCFCTLWTQVRLPLFTYVLLEFVVVRPVIHLRVFKEYFRCRSYASLHILIPPSLFLIWQAEIRLSPLIHHVYISMYRYLSFLLLTSIAVRRSVDVRQAAGLKI